MHQPGISIITVVFNGIKTIEKTIKSIVALTYPNVEYIIVDGGSNDGTLDVIKQYENHISKWISEPDQGLYDAMNKGLKMAEGDYLWFINSGDEPASPDVIHKIFSDPDAPDIYYGETMLIDNGGNEIGLRRLSPPEKLTWRHFRHGMLVSHQSFIPARRVIKKYDLSYKFYADYDWCLHALKQASDIRNTGIILSRFREGGLTGQNILPGLKERFRIMTGYYGLFPTMLAHFSIAPKFFYYWIKHKRF
jgi:glycosyltransferase involved in cell wall biosynthesis